MPTAVIAAISAEAIGYVAVEQFGASLLVGKIIGGIGALAVPATVPAVFVDSPE